MAEETCRLEGQALPQLVRTEENAGFFPCFPDAGGEQVRILSVFSAAGKRKMPRPRIFRVSNSSQNQETIPWCKAFYDGDGGRGRFRQD
jgi:hypothetical protein